MSLVTIALKSIRQRSLSSALTALSVALGVMLMVAVLVIFGIVDSAFSQRSIGYDLIVGPKGSDLQLVLSTVYRISPPIENLPYKYYEELKADKRIAEAVPIALGDVTEEGAFPIVGTIPRYFELPYAPGKEFLIRGHGFRTSLDAIIGAQVAVENGWDIGSGFKLVHGGAESDHVHDEVFRVVGVLKRTGTPNDKTVFIHLDGFYAIVGHDTPRDEAIARHREFFGTEPDPDDPDILKEVTSVLLLMKRPAGQSYSDASITAPLFAGQLKSGFKAQAVNPILPMQRLMDNFVGNVQDVLLVLTVLIIVVSGVGIFVSIYNSMADRRREIAVMRALGAQRQTVFTIILAESILLCVGGGLIGMLLGHGLVFVAAPIVARETGLLIDPFAFEWVELAVLPTLIVLASLIGVIPGMTAYRTDVARALAD